MRNKYNKKKMKRMVVNNDYFRGKDIVFKDCLILKVILHKLVII